MSLTGCFSRSNSGGLGTRMKSLTTDAFRSEITAQIFRANSRGAGHVEINSGKVHRTLGGYPGADHRMPMCCEAMRSLMLPGDEIVTEPSGGQGASLTIRYRLPR